jgi:DNA topoisomerase VI subunit A
MSDALKKIKETAGKIHSNIHSKKKPKLKFPIRSLSNVKYSPKIGYLEIGNKVKERTLSYNTVKAFSQT